MGSPHQPRQPQGSPTGGQFAVAPRGEADVSLADLPNPRREAIERVERFLAEFDEFAATSGRPVPDRIMLMNYPDRGGDAAFGAELTASDLRALLRAARA